MSDLMEAIKGCARREDLAGLATKADLTAHKKEMSCKIAEIEKTVEALKLQPLCPPPDGSVARGGDLQLP